MLEGIFQIFCFFFLNFLPSSFPKRDEKELKNSQAMLIMAVNYTLLRKRKYLDLWVHDFPTKTKFLQFFYQFSSQFYPLKVASEKNKDSERPNLVFR